MPASIRQWVMGGSLFVCVCQRCIGVCLFAATRLSGLARAVTELARARPLLTRRAPREKKARAKREPDPPLARLFYRYTPPLAVIL